MRDKLLVDLFSSSTDRSSRVPHALESFANICWAAGCFDVVMVSVGAAVTCISSDVKWPSVAAVCEHSAGMSQRWIEHQLDAWSKECRKQVHQKWITSWYGLLCLYGTDRFAEDSMRRSSSLVFLLGVQSSCYQRTTSHVANVCAENVAPSTSERIELLPRLSLEQPLARCRMPLEHDLDDCLEKRRGRLRSVSMPLHVPTRILVKSSTNTDPCQFS